MASILQISLRSGAAAVLIAAYLKCKKQKVFPQKEALPGGFLAGLFFALEYFFMGEGLRFTSPAHMAVMLYTAPVWAALGLHIFRPEERLKPLQWAGVIMSFCGIAIISWGPLGGDKSMRDVLIGDLLGLLAGFSWGATTVTIRSTKLSEAPSTQTVFIQLISAFVLLLGASAVLGRLGFTMTPALAAGLGFQIVLICFVSYLIWYWLLRVYLASHLGVLSFLTPVFSGIFTILILKGRLEPRFVAGAAVILTGNVFVSGWQMIKNLRDRKKTPELAAA